MARDALFFVHKALCSDAQVQDMSNVMKMFGLGGGKPQPSQTEAENETADSLKVTKSTAPALPPQVCACRHVCARMRWFHHPLPT